MEQSRKRVFTPAVVALGLGLIFAGLSPAFAQDETTPVADDGDPPVAALHRGDCDDPEGAPVADLGVLTPRGDAFADLGVLAPAGTAEDQGAMVYRGAHSDVTPVLSSNVALDLPFDDVFSEQQPHVLTIHESAATFGTLLACGEVAGAEADGRVVVGLRPLHESGYAGVGIFDDDDAGILGLGENQTQIAIYLIGHMPMMQAATSQADADTAAEAEATPAAAEEAIAPEDEANGATPANGDEASRAEDQEAASAEGEADNQATEDEAAVEAVTVEAIDIDFNPTQFSIPANTDVPVMLTNNGGILHTFTIDELGIDEELDPGESREITINAEPGEYVYYCTVPGHRQAGQEGTMTVE